jgi:hypothetical protein
MADAVIAIGLADELVENWDVLQLLDFDFKDVLDLLVRLTWVLSIIMLILVPVSSLLSTVLL